MEKNIKDDYGRKGTIFYYNWMRQLLLLDDESLLEFMRAYFMNCLGQEASCSNPACDALLQNYLYQSDMQGESYEKKKKHFPLEEFIPYFEKGSYSNVELAEIIGCTEGTVRHKRRAWEASKKSEEETNEKEKEKEYGKEKEYTTTVITRNYAQDKINANNNGQKTSKKETKKKKATKESLGF